MIRKSTIRHGKRISILNNERTAVNLLGRRITASVLLIKTLGGGWDASALRSADATGGKDVKHP